MKRLLPCFVVFSMIPSLAHSQPAPIEPSGGGGRTVLLLLGSAIEVPWEDEYSSNFPIHIAFSLGIGYRINHQFDLYGTYNVNLSTRVLPEESKYFAQGRYAE